ncbi:MAG: hypothetical protein C0471_19265 [Erythrobacter sp.]|nr:hypothetical protein [Erythrobacter sp.]
MGASYSANEWFLLAGVSIALLINLPFAWQDYRLGRVRVGWSIFIDCDEHPVTCRILRALGVIPLGLLIFFWASLILGLFT